MGYDKDYAQENRAMTTLRTTIEERDKERENNKRIEAEHKEVDSAIRELCEIIISKRDMNSGSDKVLLLKTGAVNYKKYPTKKLINEAKKARKEYDEIRTNLMKELHKKNSELKLECINLQEHDKINREALQLKSDEIHALKKKIIEDGQKNTKPSKEVKTTTNVKTTEEEKVRTAKTVVAAEKIATERGDEKLAKALRKNKSPNTDRERQIKEMTEIINQGGITWERAKIIFGIIGRTGASLTTDIEKEYKKYLANKKKYKTDEELEREAKRYNYALSRLTDAGLLEKGSFNLSGPRVYYQMSSLGNVIFRNIEGREAVPSHYAKVTAAHSSPQHGYGIVEIASIMREYPGRFMNISEFNKETAKNLVTHIEKDGEVVEARIEPDIIFDEKFTNAEGARVIEERYIEYELVTQSKDEYFTKIEKYIMRGTKDLFFIFPNGDLKTAFQRYVNQYLSKKKEKGIDFSDVNFYLYTTEEFSLMCEDGKSWKPTVLNEEDIKEDIKEEPKKQHVSNEKKSIEALFKGIETIS